MTDSVKDIAWDKKISELQHIIKRYDLFLSEVVKVGIGEEDHETVIIVDALQQVINVYESLMKKLEEIQKDHWLLNIKRCVKCQQLTPIDHDSSDYSDISHINVCFNCNKVSYCSDCRIKYKDYPGTLQFGYTNFYGYPYYDTCENCEEMGNLKDPSGI